MYLKIDQTLSFIPNKQMLCPCTGEITKQNYDHLINDLQDFMNGHASNIKDKIYTDMQRNQQTLITRMRQN